MDSEVKNRIHATSTDHTVRELAQFAAEHYKERTRYYEVFVRDVFVARFTLKIDKVTGRPCQKSLYPTGKTDALTAD